MKIVAQGSIRRSLRCKLIGFGTEKFYLLLAVPSPPTAPLEIRVIGANTSIFEWGIPESDGGAPLEGYNIAIRDMKKTMWIEVGRVPAGVQKFQIKDLQDDHEYMIRIYARNEIGKSEPLESEEPYKVVPGSGKRKEHFWLIEFGIIIMKFNFR